MKEQSESPTFAQYRVQQVVALSKPLWKFNVALHVACIPRYIWNGSRAWGLITGLGPDQQHETTLELAFIAVCLLLSSLPMAAVHSGRQAYLFPACALSHFGRTLVLLASGLGLAPIIEAASTCLRLCPLELVVEVVLSLEYQMSLPVMAVLHALRQVAWMTIWVNRMHGDPFHALMRGVCNWVVLLAVSCMFEWRTRCAYRKLCSTRQQQQQQEQQEKQPSLPRPVPSLPLIEGASEFTSHLPEPVKPSTGEGSGSGQGPAVQTTSGTRSARPSTDEAKCTDAVTRDMTARSAAPSSSQPAPTTASPLTYATPFPVNRVFIKVQGVEVKDMPPGAPALLQQRLQARMPRVLLAGVSVRSGCILLTLDLRLGHLGHPPTPGGVTRRDQEQAVDQDQGVVTLADGMVDLVTHLMRAGDMSELLRDGATLLIQTPTGLVSCQWDGASESYRVLDTTGSTGLTFPAHAAACHLLTVSPAVHTLPDSLPAPVPGSGPSPAAAGCLRLRVAVQLQLPSNCSLDGWQPAADALPVSPGGSAMLLARHMGGGYLPVTVERVSCVVGPGSDEAVMRHTAEVVVEVDGKAPALLCLELWYKQPPTQMAAAGSELLVSHVPLLVLPSSWRAAAVQLQQHMDHMGGVQPCQAYPAAVADSPSDAARCLLEDLGVWLTHNHSPAPCLVPDSVMSRLHDALLSHATLHGLGNVAALMNSTLQRGEQQAAHSTAAALTPAGPSTTRQLSGTAHASGSAPPPAPPSVTPQSWLGSVIEVWTTRETDEYRTWARRQRSGLVIPGAAVMTLMVLGAWYRSYKAGCGLHELPHLSLHVIPYIIMAAAIRGATWLGDWQSWMLPTHVFHSLGYLAKSFVPKGMGFVTASAASSPVTVIFVVLLSVLDQTPLPLLLVAQLVETYCHSLAYASVGIDKPLRNACFAHGCALAVSTLCRVWQLRAFRRWQAALQSREAAQAQDSLRVVMDA